jgi:hypothetical protein
MLRECALVLRLPSALTQQAVVAEWKAVMALLVPSSEAPLQEAPCLEAAV